MRGNTDMTGIVDSPAIAEQDAKNAVKKRTSLVQILSIASAIAMFVYLGGSVGAQLVRQYVGSAPSTDQAMVSALLLNIALILLVWRRTTNLTSEVHVYRQAEVRAKHLAITDPLTNLFNRRAVKDKTAELSARASRRGKTTAFMMLDLDGFKKINDLYGHDCGDQLLREVADRMRDTVPPSSILARLGRRIRHLHGVRTRVSRNSRPCCRRPD